MLVSLIAIINVYVYQNIILYDLNIYSFYLSIINKIKIKLVNKIKWHSSVSPSQSIPTHTLLLFIAHMASLIIDLFVNCSLHWNVNSRKTGTQGFFFTGSSVFRIVQKTAHTQKLCVHLVHKYLQNVNHCSRCCGNTCPAGNLHPNGRFLLTMK